MKFVPLLDDAERCSFVNVQRITFINCLLTLSFFISMYLGAVKITPSHDPSDFELAKRHSLPHMNILSDDGTLINVPSPFKVSFLLLF